MVVTQTHPLLRRGLPCLLGVLVLLAAWLMAAAVSTPSLTAAPSASVLSGAPTGGCPDRHPTPGSIAETGAEAPRPASNRACPRHSGNGSVTTASQVFRSAAADTRLQRVQDRSRGYPLEPHLRLNHGHAPPRA
ncbi:hypothetical protein [Stenotrophomonas sp. YIM B06876]|uniref:hypothetical protein n=1 Tax=Stenotrophomonas sp. YIM B06876 TaxID=3060211 RepID=UPI0027392673|nr:hypothetical protein [Stenotrophomonas sp. YIM B06876]